MKQFVQGMLGASVLVMFLAGCATPNIDKDFQFSAEKDTGLVVGSVTQDDVPGQGASYATFFFEDSNGNGHMVRSREQFLTRALVQGPDDFSDVVGRLFAIELPKGKYRFVRWNMGDGVGHFWPKKDPSPLEFTIERGKVTYIGNLHMQLATGTNIVGQTRIANVLPVVSDKSDRDLRVFASRFPKL
ncbi:MAG: hypothetical protein ACJ8KO_07340, partial [Sulfurifustaceae bacterium]